MGACFTKDDLVPERNRIDDIWKKFELVRVIGEGLSGPVKAVRPRTSNTIEYAMKTLVKNVTYSKDQFTMEVKILRKLKHENIIRLIDVYSDRSNFYILTELMEGRDLAQRVCEFPHFSEAIAARLVRKMFEVVKFCHENNIVHRDIKPANFVFGSSKDNTSESIVDELKLIDFGTAEIVTGKSQPKATVGTSHYMAPELNDRKVAKTADVLKGIDVWAIGVITHLIINGKPPFDGHDQEAIRKCALRGKPDFSDSEISETAREFIEYVLTTDHTKRPSIDQCLAHEWLREDFASDHPIAPKVLEMLQSFAVTRFADRVERKIKKAEKIGKKYSSNEIDVMRHHSSANVLIKKYSSANVISKGNNPPSPRKKYSSGLLSVPGAAMHHGNSKRASSENIVADAGATTQGALTAENLGMFQLPGEIADIEEEHQSDSLSNASMPSTRGSLSYHEPELPESISTLLNEVEDFDQMFESMAPSERIQLTIILADIVDNRDLNPSQVPSVLRSLAAQQNAAEAKTEEQSGEDVGTAASIAQGGDHTKDAAARVSPGGEHADLESSPMTAASSSPADGAVELTEQKRESSTSRDAQATAAGVVAAAPTQSRKQKGDYQELEESTEKNCEDSAESPADEEDAEAVSRQRLAPPEKATDDDSGPAGSPTVSSAGSSGAKSEDSSRPLVPADAARSI